MKYLIVGNWKLNPTSQKEAKVLFDTVKKGVGKAKNVEVVLCPPFTYLAQLKGLVLGAQNVFHEDKGAFTGEISALQLKDMGVKYVIVGHSERRKYFGETNQIINKKLKKVLHAGLTPIFCIGETAEERSAHNIQEVLEAQITQGLDGISREDAKEVVVAYEPVWAIGTGQNCSTDETHKAALLIRKIMSNLYPAELAKNLRVLYGGSVDSKNATSYITEAGVQGLLVGGASLNAQEFISIVLNI